MKLAAAWAVWVVVALSGPVWALSGPVGDALPWAPVPAGERFATAGVFVLGLVPWALACSRIRPGQCRRNSR